MQQEAKTEDDRTLEMVRSAFAGVKGGLLKGRTGTLWRRFAPISVGAIGSAAIVVGAAELARRILRRPGRRSVGWIGVLALPVLAILLRPTPADDEDVVDRTDERPVGTESGDQNGANGAADGHAPEADA